MDVNSLSKLCYNVLSSDSLVNLYTDTPAVLTKIKSLLQSIPPILRLQYVKTVASKMKLDPQRAREGVDIVCLLLQVDRKVCLNDDRIRDLCSPEKCDGVMDLLDKSDLNQSDIVTFHNLLLEQVDNVEVLHLYGDKSPGSSLFKSIVNYRQLKEMVLLFVKLQPDDIRTFSHLTSLQTLGVYSQNYRLSDESLVILTDILFTLPALTSFGCNPNHLLEICRLRPSYDYAVLLKRLKFITTDHHGFRLDIRTPEPLSVNLLSILDSPTALSDIVAAWETPQVTPSAWNLYCSIIGDFKCFSCICLPLPLVRLLMAENWNVTQLETWSSEDLTDNALEEMCHVVTSCRSLEYIILKAASLQDAQITGLLSIRPIQKMTIGRLHGAGDLNSIREQFPETQLIDYFG